MKRVPLDEAFFRGAVSLERTEKGIKPWRILYQQRALYPHLSQMAEKLSGVRLCFNSDTTKVSIFMSGERGMPVDCTVDGHLLDASRLEEGEVHFSGLAHKEKKVEIWFSPNHGAEICGLEVEDGASIAESLQDPRWIIYGSSNTMCAGASSPAQTWPAMVARQRKWELTNLGFGGQCHLDAMVARTIRDTPADIISLCIGINIYIENSLNSRSFLPAVIGFIKLIRDKHPVTPLVLISPIYADVREVTANTVGLSIQDIRDQLQYAYQLLRDQGDAHLWYVDGLTLFDEKDAVEHLPDTLHPDAEGYKVMTKNFLHKLDKCNQNAPIG